LYLFRLHKSRYWEGDGCVNCNTYKVCFPFKSLHIKYLVFCCFLYRWRFFCFSVAVYRVSSALPQVLFLVYFQLTRRYRQTTFSMRIPMSTITMAWIRTCTNRTNHTSTAKTNITVVSLTSQTLTSHNQTPITTITGIAIAERPKVAVAMASRESQQNDRC
jgi:hypothetical protein